MTIPKSICFILNLWDQLQMIFQKDFSPGNLMYFKHIYLKLYLWFNVDGYSRTLVLSSLHHLLQIPVKKWAEHV